MIPFKRLTGLGVLLASCGGEGPTPPGGGPSPPAPLASPLIGTPGAELFYGAYLDHGAAQATDYACGIKAYPGHRGVDILLRNFGTQDSGVTVVAAAAGRVSGVTDGLFDRNTVNGSGGFGNHVVIDHPAGVRTIYGHLRRGSVLVSVGQEVVAGAPLGFVGSSGNSSWPHLHFEVREGQTAVDPFRGDCNRIPASLWMSQLGYQNGFAVIDDGVSDRQSVPFAELLERLPDVGEITEDVPTVLYWAEAFNLAADSLRLELRSVGGPVRAVVAGGRATTFSMVYVTARFGVAGQLPPGAYQIDFRHRPIGASGLVLAGSRTFTVRPSTTAPRTPVPATTLEPTLVISRSGGDAPR